MEIQSANKTKNLLLKATMALIRAEEKGQLVVQHAY
jgi:hypothetical protein